MSALMGMGRRHQGATGEGGALAGEAGVGGAAAWVPGVEGRPGHPCPRWDGGCVGLAGSAGTPAACSVRPAEAEHPERFTKYEHKPVGFNQLMRNEPRRAPARAGLAG